MKKKIVLLALLVIIFSLFLLTVTQKKTISIKRPFFDVYSSLSNPDKWEKWRPDLRKIANQDSVKISIEKHLGAFAIKYASYELKVHSGGEMFEVEDGFGTKISYYTYLILPEKDPTVTSITVYRKTNMVNYLIGKFNQVSFAETHITDLKNFFETDSLYYGCTILKTKVPGSNLIEIKKEVLGQDKFKEAAQMFSSLEQYIKINHASQLHPVIVQFLARGKDSTQVNVALFIDKKVKPYRNISVVSMPKGAPLYVAKYSGRFDERQKAYSALRQYFSDHQYQSAVLPFETYLDNKLPVSDAGKVNMQVNFSSYQ